MLTLYCSRIKYRSTGLHSTILIDKGRFGLFYVHERIHVYYSTLETPDSYNPRPCIDTPPLICVHELFYGDTISVDGNDRDVQDPNAEVDDVVLVRFRLENKSLQAYLIIPY